MAKKIKRSVVPLDELHGTQLIETATKGTELACALIAGAYIENALGWLLTDVLIKNPISESILNEPSGILSAAAGRANICFCLGLIDETVYKNAKKIAQIRNQFAHSHQEIDFRNDQIIILCDELIIPEMVDENDKPIDPIIRATLLAKIRGKFTLTAVSTFVSIMIASKLRKGLNTMKHHVRCSVKGDDLSFIKAVILFDE
jgi:DNA-binding MltR family transcriptional regulator